MYMYLFLKIFSLQPLLRFSVSNGRHYKDCSVFSIIITAADTSEHSNQSIDSTSSPPESGASENCDKTAILSTSLLTLTGKG